MHPVGLVLVRIERPSLTVSRCRASDRVSFSKIPSYFVLQIESKMCVGDCVPKVQTDAN